jgi:hypothetical protein
MKRFFASEAFSFANETIHKYPLQLLVPVFLLRIIDLRLTYYLTDHTSIMEAIASHKVLQFFRDLPLNQAVLWFTFTFLLIIFAVVVNTSLEIGRIRTAIYAYDNQEKSINWSVYLNFKNKIFWYYLFTSILYVLVTLAGYVLLLIPGIILSLMFLFTLYVQVEKRSSVKQAFQRSYKLTNGIKWSLFGYTILVSFIWLAVYIPLRFLRLFLGEYALPLEITVTPTLQVFLSLAITYIYKDISYQEDHPPEPSPESIVIPVESVLSKSEKLVQISDLQTQ